MKKKEEEKLKAKARRISITEGSAYSVSEGFGIRNIIPYALALGANNKHIGFLSSIPGFLGTFSQLYALKLMSKVSRKKIAFYGALFQAVMWLPIILLGILFFFFNINHSLIPALLIFIYTLVVLFGSFFGPAWSSWMKDLVSNNQGKYFGRRNKICGFIALVSMLIAGFILDYFKKTKLVYGFMIIFGVAFLFRGVSSFLFLKKYEPEIKYEKGYYFSFFQFVKAMTKNNFGRFVLYVSLIQFATAISSPFLAVYMLNYLKFDYTTYTIIAISSSFASILFMTFWGRFADKYGNIKLIKITGFIIPIIPILWLISPLFLSHVNLVLYLIIIEAFSGIVWAGFNLSSSNFVYDAVTRQRMGLCVAYFNILNGVGIFFGAIIGGFISSADFTFFGLQPILFILLLGGIIRLIIFLIMVPKISEVKKVRKFKLKDMKEKVLTLPFYILKEFEMHIKPPRPT